MSIEQKGGIAGVVEKATSWLNPSRRYEKFTAKAKSLSDDELVAKRRRFDHVERDTIVRSAIGLGTVVGGLLVLGPHLSKEVLLLSPGPTALGISLAGPTRGIIRRSERDILDEEIESRGLKPQEAVVYQSKV